MKRLRSRNSLGDTSLDDSIIDDTNNGGGRKKNNKASPIVKRRLRSKDQEDSISSDKTKVFNDSITKTTTNGRGFKRLKLKYYGPRQSITHPDHVIKPNFSNLEEYLNSFKFFQDDEFTNSEYEDKIEEESQLVKKIRTAIQNKVLQIDPVNFKIVKRPKPKPFVDPFKTILTHHDHLLSQGMTLSKIFEDGRKAKINRTKKINNMIETHFKRLAGEADREIKEHDKKMKRLARDTGALVKKRWKEVEKAYKIIVDKRKELEKIEEGKKTMNRMVMNSSLRAVGHAISGGNSNHDKNDSDSSESESDVDDSEIEKNDGSESSNDELKPEIDKKVNEDDDSKLTQEQLRQKYSFLNNYEIEKNESDSEEEEGSELEGEKSQTADNDEEIITDADRERYKTLQQEDHASLLDSDEFLSDSDDESDESDDEESEEEEEEESNNGLASLFGQTITKDESDDEEMKIEEEETYLSDSEGKIDLKSDSEEKINSKSNNEKIDLKSNNKEESNCTEIKTNGKTPEIKSKQEDSSASIPDVPYPPLLKGQLRIYQKQGLNWLANLYNNNTNGILADEMGLGKTIQTISLICWLACEKQNWGPHLIVVPTSVMLNWEMEFKRFAPGFKILTYYGNPQQRKEKRRGWNKPNSFHVCITSYQLVLHDNQSFKRRKWEYMILDEAHNIKNFRTARWQALLNFNTNRRLLLTGTPLQNNLAELWSLLYFLMPSAKNVSNMPEGFASLEDFQQWFGRPVDKIIEGGSFEADFETKETISKLHKVLRPYLLRRLKIDVETQMPLKYEHIVYCRLSKRQRFLYDDFMSRAQTKETLASGNFLSIINCLMQLRKVCNHPDLFEVRPILTSFVINNSLPGVYNKNIPNYLKNLLNKDINLELLGYIFTNNENNSTHDFESIKKLSAKKFLMKDVEKLKDLLLKPIDPNYEDINEFYKYFKYIEQNDALDHSTQTVYINDLRCSKKPIYGENLLKLLNVKNFFNDAEFYLRKDNRVLNDLIKPLSTRILTVKESVDNFAFITPSVVTLDYKNQLIPKPIISKIQEVNNDFFSKNSLHEAQMKLSIQFPDKNLLLYDSGKLQKLAKLLYELKSKGHRALIFTQMTKVLDILEKFLNNLGYLYSRLDGATKIEDRQILTERFNRDSRITCFILSTRSGGLGINLTGADTVIFYDNDWNPAMDKQCQDRCHRIGQTRDVHIYRFVSEFTIEENIMRKSNYKRKLDNVVIQEGDFTTDYFGKLTLNDILGTEISKDASNDKLLMTNGNIDTLAQAEDAEDAAAAKEAIKETELDDEDFDEVNKSKTATPGPIKEKSVSFAPIENDNNDNNDVNDDVNEEDEEQDDGIGHVDEYMLRFIEEGFYF